MHKEILEFVLRAAGDAVQSHFQQRSAEEYEKLTDKQRRNRKYGALGLLIFIIVTFSFFVFLVWYFQK